MENRPPYFTKYWPKRKSRCYSYCYCKYTLPRCKYLGVNIKSTKHDPPHAPASAIKKVKRREHKQTPTKVLWCGEHTRFSEGEKTTAKAKPKMRAKATKIFVLRPPFRRSISMKEKEDAARAKAVEAAEMQLAEAFFAKELRTNENDGYASDSSGYMSLTD
eukprot:COSAG06_NODE_3387_length_5414_cov_372.123048_2_plen_161_part_00